MSRYSVHLTAVVLGSLCSLAWCAEPQRLDRRQLLQMRDEQGQVQNVSSAKEWELRRVEIVAGMQHVMGPFPADQRRVPLDIQIEQEEDAGAYVRQLITYQSEPDCRTPAYLCIPKQARTGTHPAPAVLCLHPTDNAVGHQVVVGLGGLPRRNYAAELAARGYVTLSPSYPHLANYWPNLQKLGYESGTMKAIWDNSRALDLLESLPYVDTSHGIAAIGHSLGGHNAIFTAVFEPRISVLVTSCGFDSFLHYYDGAERYWLFGAGWCQIRYMPRLSHYHGRLTDIPFDFHELLGAIAPRPIFINAPLQDANFRWQSVDECVAAAHPVYELLGNAGGMVVEHPDCEHDFPDVIRQQAYAFIDGVLRPEAK